MPVQPLTTSSSVAALPTLPKRARGLTSAPASDVNGSSSAPVLHALAVGQVAVDLREGVERVVSRLKERPGIAQLLTLRDSEHSAAVLKARVAQRRSVAPAPKLLLQPQVKRAALSSLSQRTSVLSDSADELGFCRRQSDFSLLDDLNGATDVGGDPRRAQTALLEGPQTRAERRAALVESSYGAAASYGSKWPPPDLLPLGASVPGLKRPPSMRVSCSTSSLHANRAAAAKAEALLATRLNQYLLEYRRVHSRDSAIVVIQAAWRGRSGRDEKDRLMEIRRAELGPILNAWRTVVQADRRFRRGTLSACLWGWFQERLEARYYYTKLGLMLTRALGSGAASQYWRSMIEKRKRIPRPADTPTVAVALARALQIQLAKRTLFLWRRHCRRVDVLRQQASKKLKLVAKPTNLWPSEMLSLALLLWSRIAKFRRCTRQCKAPPVYLRYVPQWHEWETKAVQKLQRVEVATELQGPALLRRMFRKWSSLPRLEAEVIAATDGH